MKKRCISLILLAVFLLTAFPVAARADVMVIPNNYFYQTHTKECVWDGHDYYVNSKSGNLALVKSPGSNDEMIRIENGAVIHISYTYDLDGVLWGLTWVNIPGEPFANSLGGWVLMSALVRKYSLTDFAEEHKNEFYRYYGDYGFLHEKGDIVFWTWPGSGLYSWVMEITQKDTERNENLFTVNDVYKDADGREWGFTSYKRTPSWICISDPGNTDIPAFNPPPEYTAYPPVSSAVMDNFRALKLAAILVAALVIVTLILLKIFWKRKKDKQQ